MRKMKRYFVAPLLLVFAAAFCMQFYAGKLVGILQDDEILLAMIIVLVGAVYSIGRLVRHWQYKRKGKEMPKMNRKDRMVRISIFAALLLAELVLIFLRQSQSWKRPVEEVGIEYVSLADLEKDGFSLTASQRFDNEATFRTSFVVPEQYDLRMAGKNAEGLPVTMQVCLYEAASESLAEPLFDAIMTARMDWNQILMQWEIETEVDEAYAAGYMGFQYLFLREESRIVTVYYYGEQDLAEQVELFAEMLQQ